MLAAHQDQCTRTCNRLLASYWMVWWIAEPSGPSSPHMHGLLVLLMEGRFPPSIRRWLLLQRLWRLIRRTRHVEFLAARCRLPEMDSPK